MNFTDVVPDSTIGLSFDTYSNIFSIYYKEQIKRFTIKSERKLDKITPFFYEGSNPGETFKDKVSVNFGASPFKYNISGFTPWEYNHEEKTCYHNKKNQINPLLNIFIFTFSS